MGKFKRTFVVGDIHGGYKGLKQVLVDSNFDYENDRLISLGDLADGWSETHLVIEELKKIKNLILLRGNHDEWAMMALSTRYREEIYTLDKEAFKISEQYYTPSFFKITGQGRNWYAHGGIGTEHSYELRPDLICDHIKFLSSAHIYYIDENDRLYAHAGPHPRHKGIGLKEADPYDFYWNREFWRNAMINTDPGKYWNEVYIGHTPTIKYDLNPPEDNTKPIKRKNVWNMDTGACFTGKISLMNVDTKELYQSEVLRKLYPNEKGRMRKSYNDS